MRRVPGITAPRPYAATAAVRRLATDFSLSRRRALQHALALCALLRIAPLALTGCAIVGDLFKAGVCVGILLVGGVIVLLIWLVSRIMS